MTTTAATDQGPGRGVQVLGALLQPRLPEPGGGQDTPHELVLRLLRENERFPRERLRCAGDSGLSGRGRRAGRASRIGPCAGL